jgi:hypothetical protein
MVVQFLQNVVVEKKVVSIADSSMSNFSAIPRLSSLPVTGLQILTYA